MTGIVLQTYIVDFQAKWTVHSLLGSHGESKVGDPVQRYGSLTILDTSLRGEKELGEGNLGYLPVGTAAGVQDIVIDVVPHQIEVALGVQIDQVAASIASHLHDQHVVLRPVVGGLPLEGFLGEKSITSL